MSLAPSNIMMAARHPFVAEEGSCTVRMCYLFRAGHDAQKIARLRRCGQAEQDAQRITQVISEGAARPWTLNSPPSTIPTPGLRRERREAAGRLPGPRLAWVVCPAIS